MCQGLTMSAREGASLYLDPAAPRLINRNALDHTNTTQFSPGDGGISFIQTLTLP